MESTTDFSTKVIEAVAEKAAWYDTTELPKLLDDYRNIKAYINNFITILKRKGLIQDDIYKHEKKIAEIKPIEDSPFLETERASIIGTRISDYDNMLDFIISNVKFTVAELTNERIKKLCAFNNSISWNGITNTSPQSTVKAIAAMINIIKVGSDSMSVSMVNDIISLLGKEILSINAKFKELTDFQREVYKAAVRKNIFMQSSFQSVVNKDAPQTIVPQIRKVYLTSMGKKPFYTELIEEIVAEEYSAASVKLQQKLLAKLAIASPKQETTSTKNNAREVLMSSVRILGSSASQLEVIANKLEENTVTLEGQHNSLFHRFVLALRKAFGLPEKPIEYRVSITENITQTSRMENVRIQDFLTDIEKRARLYATISLKTNPGYQKLDQLDDLKIFEFLNKQIVDCQKILIILAALDSYYKSEASEINRVRIRGLKIEISAVKGILHKANQEKAEFAAYLEEKSQMLKLGIPHV